LFDITYEKLDGWLSSFQYNLGYSAYHL